MNRWTEEVKCKQGYTASLTFLLQIVIYFIKFSKLLFISKFPTLTKQLEKEEAQHSIKLIVLFYEVPQFTMQNLK